MAKKQEFYDPDQKNFHFHSSHNERVSHHSQRYYQKIEENRKRSRRSRRLILADLAIITLIILFFAFGRPYLLARESLLGCRFHLSFINLESEKSQLLGYLKVKNNRAKEGEIFNIKATYGTQVKESQLMAPKKGTLGGQEFSFTKEEDENGLLIEIKKGDRVGRVKATLERLSFF